MIDCLAKMPKIVWFQPFRSKFVFVFVFYIIRNRMFFWFCIVGSKKQEIYHFAL